MPRQGDYTNEEAKDLLEDYVLPKECATSVFPRDLKPEQVSAFVRNDVKKDLSAGPMRRATQVVRFYNLKDCVEQLSGYFSMDEKTKDDFIRAGHLIVMMAELGTADEQDAAVKQFERLVAAPAAANEGLETLCQTFFSLPPKASPAAIRKRVADARAECERKGPEQKLGLLMEYEIRLLPWVISAKARKDGILTLPRGPERLQRWTEAYLAYENTTPFTWDGHAGYALAQEGREAGDKTTYAAVTAAMGKIEPNKDDKELTLFRKTRGYRAREYFLEPLTDVQKDDLKDSERVQEDLIA